jgi:hypothetical protein
MRLLIFILSFILFSCDNSVEDKLEDITENSDKVEIFFYNGMESNIDDKSKIVVISDKNEIERIMKFVSSEDTPEYKCGYNGSISFFKENVLLLEMEFNIEVQCNHFSFILNSAIFYKEMTGEGRSYLENLMLNPEEKNITKGVAEFQDK